MKKINNTYNGYIMIFTLLIIGASMMIVTYVGHRGSFYLPFSHMIIAREKAKMLAFSGIHIAIAQLSQSDKKDKTGKADLKPTASSEKTSQESSIEKDFLARILPTLNRWQDFDLKEATDGIDAHISICMMCEDAKINLNHIIDFKKGTIKGSDKSGWKAILQELFPVIERTIGGADLFTTFEKIVKERKSEFNDATELITQKAFNAFKDILFYQPPQQKKAKETFYLTDIFTVFSSSDKLQPWLFSDSINGLLGLPRVEVDDIKNRKEQTENWLKNFKVKSNWQQDWNTILKPIYGKELKTLPKNIDSILNPTFAPRFFSVRVHAIVADVTQMVYVILERIATTQDDETTYDVEIKKLYWL